MADLPVVFSFMVRCGLEAHVRYKKELNKLLSSFDFRCGLCLSADMSSQPVAVIMNVTACLQKQPEININYGDVVWDGEKAIVVAFL